MNSFRKMTISTPLQLYSLPALVFFAVCALFRRARTKATRQNGWYAESMDFEFVATLIRKTGNESVREALNIVVK